MVSVQSFIESSQETFNPILWLLEQRFGASDPKWSKLRRQFCESKSDEERLVILLKARALLEEE